jgi:hypothetical protein
LGSQSVGSEAIGDGPLWGEGTTGLHSDGSSLAAGDGHPDHGPSRSTSLAYGTQGVLDSLSADRYAGNAAEPVTAGVMDTPSLPPTSPPSPPAPFPSLPGRPVESAPSAAPSGDDCWVQVRLPIPDSFIRQHLFGAECGCTAPSHRLSTAFTATRAGLRGLLAVERVRLV